MSTNFPTSLDTLSNPTSTDKLNAGSGHADQHADANDAIEALQAKVGIDSSAVTTSHDYKIAALETVTGIGAPFVITPASSVEIDADNGAVQTLTQSGDVTFTMTGTANRPARVYLFLHNAAAGVWDVNFTSFANVSGSNVNNGPGVNFTALLELLWDGEKGWLLTPWGDASAISDYDVSGDQRP